MNKENIKKTLSHSLKNLHSAKFQGRKSVFCQILWVKNLYLRIKSVWVAGLLETYWVVERTWRCTELWKELGDVLTCERTWRCTDLWKEPGTEKGDETWQWAQHINLKCCMFASLQEYFKPSWNMSFDHYYIPLCNFCLFKTRWDALFNLYLGVTTQLPGSQNILYSYTYTLEKRNSEACSMNKYFL